MKWYKFLVNFWLWAKAFIHLLEGVLLLSGGIYKLTGTAAEVVYAEFAGIKTVDLYGGIIFLVLALVSLSVRGKLKNFKENAPQNFYAFLALELMADVIYMILVSYMKGVGAPWAEVIVSALVWAVYFGLNFVYFKKRNEMFLN